jgi:hypothetical protein
MTITKTSPFSSCSLYLSPGRQKYVTDEDFVAPKTQATHPVLLRRKILIIVKQSILPWLFGRPIIIITQTAISASKLCAPV